MIEVKGQLVKDFKHWVFPGGEVGVKFEFNDSGECLFVIDWKVENKSNLHQEFFIVANAVDAIKQKYPEAGIYLYIPYFPYARQDRVCHEGESHAMAVFEKMLLSLDVKDITVDDLHSKNNKLYEEASVIPQSFCIVKYDLSYYDFIVAPDHGAKEKAKSLRNLNAPDAFLVTLDKVRKDGRVIHEDLPTMKAFSERGLIVDDICDGGATFISAAQAIKKNNPHVKLDLYVTHGIFSKGLDELKLHFNKIFCYNLMNLDLADQVEHII